jgi:transcriptional regulator with XRE-family HTH domain
MKNASEKYGYDSCFPTRFRKLMELNKVSQKAMAELCGVQRQSISLWYNGDTRPDIVSLGKIAQYFGVSTDYLLGLTDYKTTDKATQELCNTLGLSEEAIKILSADPTSSIAKKLEEIVEDLLEDGEKYDVTTSNIYHGLSSDVSFVINKLVEEYIERICLSTGGIKIVEASLLNHLKQFYLSLEAKELELIDFSDIENSLVLDGDKYFTVSGKGMLLQDIRFREFLINSAIGEINTRLHNIKHEKLGE